MEQHGRFKKSICARAGQAVVGRATTSRLVIMLRLAAGWTRCHVTQRMIPAIKRDRAREIFRHKHAHECIDVLRIWVKTILLLIIFDTHRNGFHVPGGLYLMASLEHAINFGTAIACKESQQGKSDDGHLTHRAGFFLVFCGVRRIHGPDYISGIARYTAIHPDSRHGDIAARALRGAIFFSSARAARAGSDILRGLRAPGPPAILRFARIGLPRGGARAAIAHLPRCHGLRSFAFGVSEPECSIARFADRQTSGFGQGLGFKTQSAVFSAGAGSSGYGWPGRGCGSQRHGLTTCAPALRAFGPCPCGW